MRCTSSGSNFNEDGQDFVGANSKPWDAIKKLSFAAKVVSWLDGLLACLLHELPEDLGKYNTRKFLQAVLKKRSLH